MTSSGLRRLLRIALVTLVLANLVAAVTAANSVATTRAGQHSEGIGPNQLKPPECDGLTLHQTVSGSGTVTGTLLNDLVLGSAAADTIDGLTGDDCILGGDGDDIIRGGLLGNDVCIGGPGNDTFTGCETEIQ